MAPKRRLGVFIPAGASKCNESSAIALGAAGCLEDSTLIKWQT